MRIVTLPCVPTRSVLSVGLCLMNVVVPGILNVGSNQNVVAKRRKAFVGEGHEKHDEV